MYRDSDWSRTIATVLVYGALIGALVLGSWTCRSGECSTVCRANGDNPEQTWTQGCFCRDENGHLYNPRDSR